MPKPLRYCRIFLAEDRPGVISATHFNSAGIYYEQDAATVLNAWRDPMAITAAGRSALARFSFREANLRDRKKTDWPSYITSRCRSVREFESLYLCIDVQAVDEAGLFYDAHAQPRGENDITLHVAINRYALDEEIGRQLLKLFDACCRWTSNAS